MAAARAITAILLRRRSSARLLVIAAIAISSAVGSLASANAQSVPRCHTADLRARVRMGGVGLGNADATLVLANNGDHRCSVYGYVGLGLQDGHRHHQRTIVTWGSTYFHKDPRPHLVILGPGDQATADLAWSNTPSAGEPSHQCEPLSAWLEVTPPDETRHLVVAFSARVCGHGHLWTTALAAPAGNAPRTRAAAAHWSGSLCQAQAVKVANWSSHFVAHYDAGVTVYPADMSYFAIRLALARFNAHGCSPATLGHVLLRRMSGRQRRRLFALLPRTVERSLRSAVSAATR